VFERIHKHYSFVVIFFITIVLQILIIEVRITHTPAHTLAAIAIR
jgi:hypothetical protein